MKIAIVRTLDLLIKRTGFLLENEKVPHTIHTYFELYIFHQISYFGLTLKTWGADCIHWLGDCLPFLNGASFYHSNFMSFLSKPWFGCIIYLFGSCYKKIKQKSTIHFFFYNWKSRKHFLSWFSIKSQIFEFKSRN